MQKRKFYIIAHNPNTLREAEDFLQAGANALEPDICFDAARPERFYVSHGTPGSNPFTPEHSLVNYLRGLTAMLADESNNYNLALIAFDIKSPDFDINEFVRTVFDNFSGHTACEGVAVLVTVSSLAHAGALCAYEQASERVAVGIDEENSPRDVESAFRRGGQRRFTYANGSILTDVKFGLFKSIMTAKALQARGDSFRLVYTWVLKRESPMRSYLDLHIDGVIVDVETVPHLLEILGDEHFGASYELARNGFNPFDAPPAPAYLLTIRTRDAQFAGTDARVKFTLEGAAAALESTLDADYRDVLERGGTDFLTLEGAEVGDIRSLTVAAQSGGLNAEWLPESITVESSLLHAPLTFNYGPEDWLKLGQPITKTPA
jgi:PLAT/LH2 domain